MKANPFSKIKNMISACFETNTLKSVLSGAGIKSNLLIFDIGAHKGQTSSHFCKLFPQSIIHAFEPSPYLFAEADKNLSKKKNIICHNFALGDTMKKHLLLDLIPIYVDKLSKPKRTIPRGFQSVSSMDSAYLKIFLKLTY
jgi:hypothetical protein